MVLDKAFDAAYEKMEHLPDKEWARLITEIVLAGTVTETRYIKVPETDIPRYTRRFYGEKVRSSTQLNAKLAEQGHLTQLELDPEAGGLPSGRSCSWERLRRKRFVRGF